MIIKVNSSGILISVVGNADLIKRYKTPIFSIPVTSIELLCLAEYPTIGTVVQLEDDAGDDFYLDPDDVTDLNGANTYASAELLLAAINTALLGLTL